MTGNLHDIAGQLSAIRVRSDELNAACDRAADVFSAVDAFLGEECRVGIAAAVELGDVCPGFLAYGRDADRKFHIGHREDLHGTLKRMSSCGREVRLAAVAALPRLIAALSEAVAAELEESRDVVEDLERLDWSQLPASKKGNGPDATGEEDAG